MASKSLRCPTCFDSSDLRRSHMRARDLPMVLIGMHVYRCLTCYKRFYTWKRRTPRAQAEQKVASGGS